MFTVSILLAIGFGMRYTARVMRTNLPTTLLVAGFALLSIFYAPATAAGESAKSGMCIAWKDQAHKMFVMTQDGRIAAKSLPDDYEGFFVKETEDGGFTKCMRADECVIIRDVRLSGVIRYNKMLKGGNPRVGIPVHASDTVATVSASFSVGAFDYEPLIDKEVDFIADAIYLPHTEESALIQTDGNDQGFYLTNFRLADHDAE